MRWTHEVARYPHTIVEPLRRELAMLTRAELIERYATSPGAPRDARRTLLSSAVLIDILVWTSLDSHYRQPKGDTQ